MAFEIELVNADTVTPECLARAIDLVVHEFEGRLIEAIKFGDDMLGVEMFGECAYVDFPVKRTGDRNAY
jgi:hypothetical protein